MAVEVKSTAKHLRISASKAGQILPLIRGKSALEARDILRFIPKESARLALKVLESAIANAENNHSLDPETLVVWRAFADQGTTMKRFRARARGSAARIRKRTSHITVVLKPREEM